MVAGGTRIGAFVALLAVLGAVVAPTASPAHRQRGASLTALESGVLQELNKIRVAHGLQPVRLNAHLTAAADQHSQEMASDGYFAHESHDGSVFWKRIVRFYGDDGYGLWSVGENLLWCSPDVDPSDALDMWMNSPEHRRNILTARWREIGVSAVHVADAPGAYRGQEVTIITTDFGVRR